MSKPMKKCWSQSFGAYGNKVRVAELKPGGKLYLLWVDSRGLQRKKSLGHRDRRRGKEEAQTVASRLGTLRKTTEQGRLTLGQLTRLYLLEGLHGRTERHRKCARRQLELVSCFFGVDRPVDTLCASDVERFEDARLAGALTPPGRKGEGGVSRTTVWHDIVALKTALNWATRYRDGQGRALLRENPLRGVHVSKTRSPARPVADESRYQALRAVGDRVDVLFSLALDLAHATGHRINAILHLRWDDVHLERTHDAPYGSIRWRGQHDKIENEHVTPLAPLAHGALAAAFQRRPAIGAAWVFPSPSDDSRPLDRHLANRWFRKAEEFAGVEHVKGTGWHSLRRGWASRRRHLPDVDVAAAGGWKDTGTMKRCYQHTDPEGLLRAVTGGVSRPDPEELSKELSHPSVRQG